LPLQFPTLRCRKLQNFLSGNHARSSAVLLAHSFSGIALSLRIYKIGLKDLDPLALLARQKSMDVKLVILILAGVFILASLFFGTQNGFYNSQDYHGDGSSH
jgi:hypothetical protein